VDLAAVDTPLVTLGDINRGRWLPRFTNHSATVFSYALNNYWSAKWAGKKSGRLICSYAITSGAGFDAVRSSRFGREARALLETAELKNSDKLSGARGTLPRAEAGFATLTPENVVLTALKPAENGGDLIARVLETSGQGGQVALNLPFLRLSGARKADAVETPGEALQSDSNSVRFHIGPCQALTLRLSLTQAE
jgi:alpha-mannosidase